MPGGKRGTVKNPLARRLAAARRDRRISSSSRRMLEAGARAEALRAAKKKPKTLVKPKVKPRRGVASASRGKRVR